MTDQHSPDETTAPAPRARTPRRTRPQAGAPETTAEIAAEVAVDIAADITADDATAPAGFDEFAGTDGASPDSAPTRPRRRTLRAVVATVGILALVGTTIAGVVALNPSGPRTVTIDTVKQWNEFVDTYSPADYAGTQTDKAADGSQTYLLFVDPNGNKKQDSDEPTAVTFTMTAALLETLTIIGTPTLAEPGTAEFSADSITKLIATWSSYPHTFTLTNTMVTVTDQDGTEIAATTRAKLSDADVSALFDDAGVTLTQ